MIFAARARRTLVLARTCTLVLACTAVVLAIAAVACTAVGFGRISSHMPIMSENANQPTKEHRKFLLTGAPVCYGLL